MRRVRSPLRGNGKIRASAFYTEKCGVSKSRISRLNADALIAYNFKEKGFETYLIDVLPTIFTLGCLDMQNV